LFTIYL